MPPFLLDAEADGGVVDDGSSGRDRGAGGTDRHGAPLPEILQRGADGLAPGAIRPLRGVGDGVLKLLAGVAAHRLGFAPGLVGE